MSYRSSRDGSPAGWQPSPGCQFFIYPLTHNNYDLNPI